MCPKFRGDSQDWLDDEKSKRSSGRSANKAKRSATDSPTAHYLPETETNAVVIEVYPKLCRVRLDAEGATPLCSMKRAAILGAKGNDPLRVGRDRSPLAVGDRVHVQRSSIDSGVITGMSQRRNEVIRPAPGRDGGALFHVIAANVDQVIIVSSASQPEFSDGLVDRFLVLTEASQIQAALVVTKIDLPHADRPWGIYPELGYPVFEISHPLQIGLEAIKEFLKGKISVLCGHSGVGKTTLLNALLPGTEHRVGSISESGKGRHTTSSAILLPLGGEPDAGGIIDTPGVKELGLGSLKTLQIAAAFPEFRALGCNSNRCEHRDEAGCDARKLPRYASYLRLVEAAQSAAGTDGQIEK